MVKAIAAILHGTGIDIGDCTAALAQHLSPVDISGPARLFSQTDYYRDEMGADLMRTLVSFEALQAVTFLIEARHVCHDVEQEFAFGGNRRFNIDVGYLDLHKVVLASFKGRGTKVYLDSGVWADMTLEFRAGQFHPFPWTFPDFREGAYDDELKRIRERYKEQLRDR